MRTFLVTFALLFASAGSAQDSPKTMTKIVVQLDSPGLPADSFARKPKSIYRSGNKFCRVEEAPDTEHGIHGVLIVNEPDAWMINLFDKTARHMVDPGPTFNCRLPIFSSPLPGGADDVDYAKLGLEFGHELEFFNSKNAQVQKGQVMQGKETVVHFLQIGNTKIALFTYGPNDFPLALGRTCEEKGEILWYSGYGQVPFDPKLFSRPEGVTIEELKK